MRTDEFTECLHELARRRVKTPCQRDPAPFLSDDVKERRAAAATCQTCPLLVPCGEHADAMGETWSVWGGRDRQTRPTTTKEPK